MKISEDGFIDLTWKETLETWHGATSIPRWKRFLTPLQHWFACAFRGHQSVNINEDLVSDPIPGTGQPRCRLCEEVMAFCMCDQQHIAIHQRRHVRTDKSREPR